MGINQTSIKLLKKTVRKNGANVSDLNMNKHESSHISEIILDLEESGTERHQGPEFRA